MSTPEQQPPQPQAVRPHCPYDVILGPNVNKITRMCAIDVMYKRTRKFVRRMGREYWDRYDNERDAKLRDSGRMDAKLFYVLINHSIHIPLRRIIALTSDQSWETQSKIRAFHIYVSIAMRCHFEARIRHPQAANATLAFMIDKFISLWACTNAATIIAICMRYIHEVPEWVTNTLGPQEKLLLTAPPSTPEPPPPPPTA